VTEAGAVMAEAVMAATSGDTDFRAGDA